MHPLAGKLAAEINAPEADPQILDRLLVLAEAIITQILGAVRVPEGVAAWATVVTAADLWAQREAPHGLKIFADGMGGTVPVRVRSQVTVRARAVLDMWLPPVVV